MSLGHFTKWLVAATLAATAGCGTGGTVPVHDAGPDAAGGSGGTGAGGADAGDTCGQCAIGSPILWADATLVWFGDETDAPDCPAGAPKIVYEGHADLVAPHDCGTCTCGSPSGSCGLPLAMTANAATCALDNGSTTHTTFDPASDWDGTCDADVAIASGKLCAGVKCVQSLTVGPLAVNENGCTPSQPLKQSEPAWKIFARACSAFPQIACQEANGFCLAAPPPEAGFRVCISQSGDNDCVGPVFPPYTEKHVFYQHYEDTRACADCTCSSPAGSACSSTVSIYTDGACSTLAYSATVTSSGPACHDLPAGSPLGSKFATAPTYASGTCAPAGGEPMGAVTLIQPLTLCCVPLP